MGRMVATVVAFVLLLATRGADPAIAASSSPEDYDQFEKVLVLWHDDPFFWLTDQTDPMPEPSGMRAATVRPLRSTYRLHNFGAKTEPGEPTINGKMKKTVWAKLVAPRNARVVVNTFGTEFDTLLSAYRGTSLKTLKRLALNDNTDVPGLTGMWSLVEIDVKKGETYHFQIGSKAGTEGDIILNVSILPPGGGLSLFLATIDGFVFNGQDFVCAYGSNFISPCGSPRFVLHNSRRGAITVTPSATLGGGLGSPAAFAMAPGSIAVKDYSFTAGFDKTTVRTVSGLFQFTARVGAAVVDKATQRALVVVKNLSTEVAGPSVRAIPQARGAGVNAFASYRLTLTNSGAQTLVDCHAHAQAFFPMKVAFRRINPANGKSIGAPLAPVDIEPGTSATIEVAMASQQAIDGDLTSQAPAVVECANSAAAANDLLSHFDIWARGTFAPAVLDIARTSPAADALDVPAAGSTFRVSAINHDRTRTLKAVPVYRAPSGETAAAKQFKVEVCRAASAKGPCATPFAASLSYRAVKNARVNFIVRVRRPTSDPGFDPAKRRAYLDFQQQAAWVKSPAVVGTASVAVRRK